MSGRERVPKAMRESLGRDIRRARTTAGFRTAQDLATAIGHDLSRKTVSAWENGRNWPQPQWYPHLKRLLDIDVPGAEKYEEYREQGNRVPALDVAGYRRAISEMQATLARMLAGTSAEDDASVADTAKATTQADAAKLATPASSTATRRRRQG